MACLLTQSLQNLKHALLLLLGQRLIHFLGLLWHEVSRAKNRIRWDHAVGFREVHLLDGLEDDIAQG